MTWDEGEHEGCGKDSERAFRQWKERAEHAESVLAEQDRIPADGFQPYSYPHMCRDDHIQIGHKDSEHEMCPLCRTIAFLRILLGEDDRFQIAIGGNPIAVDRMMAEARRTLSDVGGSGK